MVFALAATTAPARADSASVYGDWRADSPGLRRHITPADLPLSCPMPGMYLWNSHPRVYLAIEPTGWAKCSYCGAEYTLNRG